MYNHRDGVRERNVLYKCRIIQGLFVERLTRLYVAAVVAHEVIDPGAGRWREQRQFSGVSGEPEAARAARQVIEVEARAHRLLRHKRANASCV